MPGPSPSSDEREAATERRQQLNDKISKIFAPMGVKKTTLSALREAAASEGFPEILELIRATDRDRVMERLQRKRTKEENSLKEHKKARTQTEDYDEAVEDENGEEGDAEGIDPNVIGEETKMKHQPIIKTDPTDDDFTP